MDWIEGVNNVARDLPVRQGSCSADREHWERMIKRERECVCWIKWFCFFGLGIMEWAFNYWLKLLPFLFGNLPNSDQESNYPFPSYPKYFIFLPFLHNSLSSASYLFPYLSLLLKGFFFSFCFHKHNIIIIFF